MEKSLKGIGSGSSMDSKQVWYGYYLPLDEVYKFLSRQDEAAHRYSKVHELFITWVVARFLRFQKKSEHVIGFPSFVEREGLTLIDLLAEQIVLDHENFDTVIADVADLNTPIRLQIKRYTRMQNATTEHFFEYLCSKVQRYGNAPEINVVFHVLQDMKFNIHRFAELLNGRSFKVGSIFVFAGTRLKQKCFLFEAYPNYTGVLWSPEAESDQSQSS